MPTTPDQIDLLRQSKSEDQRLEFKEAQQQYDFNKLCNYCVTLANEDGGKLILGIGDKPPRRVVGTQACNDTVGMAQKLFTKVGFRVDIDEVAHPEGRVVVFHIPSRPRGSGFHPDGTYLMRSGESLVPMSEDQLRKIFAEGEPDWLEQSSQTDLASSDVIELLDTQTYFELLHLPYPTDQVGAIEKTVAGTPDRLNPIGLCN